jgi:hypothetical protein
MSNSSPLELLTDVAGSVTFGWADDSVYYARFSRCLSAKLGEAFADRLRASLPTSGCIKYFADGRELESYDLLARSAFVRVVSEHRKRFEQINLLTWSGGQPSPAFLAALGEPVFVARDEVDFESRLLAIAPRARTKLGGKSEPAPRSRWLHRR